MDLSTFLKALQYIGPATAAIGEVRKVIESAVDALHLSDQATAKEALADLMADNDEGHRRLQQKLADAARN